jgi:hypothetical protein
MPAALLHVAQEKEGRGDYRACRNTQAVLLRPRLVLNAALRRPGVAEWAAGKRQKGPAAWLHDHLVLDFPQGAEVTRVRVKGADAREAAVLANAVAESYRAEVVNKGNARQAERLMRLKALAAKYEESLRERRVNVRELSPAVGSGDAQARATKQRFAREALATTQKELLQARSEPRKLRLELQALTDKEQRSGDAAPPDTVLDEQIERGPQVQQLRQAVEALKRELARVRRAAKGPDPEPAVKQRVADLQAARESLQARRQGLRPTRAKPLREKAQADGKAAAARRRERSAFLEQLARLLTAEVDRLGRQAQGLAKAPAEVDDLREEIAQMGVILKEVAAEAGRLEMERSTPPRVTLVEQAEAPREK